MEATAIQLNQSQVNGIRFKSKILERFYNVVLGIMSTALIGLFTFLWNLNSTLAQMKEKNISMQKSFDDVNIKLNNVQLDIRDLRDKTIRIETRQNIKPR